MLAIVEHLIGQAALYLHGRLSSPSAGRRASTTARSWVTMMALSPIFADQPTQQVSNRACNA